MCFFNDTATTEIYTLSLHDALPILPCCALRSENIMESGGKQRTPMGTRTVYRIVVRSELSERFTVAFEGMRSEEHTSELQSRQYLVCRLLLEKKKLYTSPPQFLRFL